MEVSLWVVRTICLPDPPILGSHQRSFHGALLLLLHVFLHIYSLNLSPPSTVCADVEQGCRGWEAGPRPGLAVLLGLCGRAQQNYLPPISPDFPGASEVGESLGGAAEGPGGAQKLDYFCNTAHLQPAAEKVNLWAQGWNARAGQQGELRFPPFWQLRGPCCALWGRWGCLQLSEWTREMATVQCAGDGGNGHLWH